jgi:ribosome-associated translation inhibitor RaiA
MFNMTFKDLRRSEIAEGVVAEKLNHIFKKFPELKNHKVSFSMAMLNSPLHAGPDLFSAKIRIVGRKFNNLIIEKKASNLYKAISQVFSSILELLNRHKDKARSKSKSLARREIRKQRMLLGY